MSTNMSFSVYLTQPLRKEYALIIITTGEDSDSFFSEYFILVKTDHNRMMASRHYYKDAHLLKTEFNYNLKMIEEATLHVVQAELDSYLLSKYEEDKDHFWIDIRFKPESIPNHRLIMFVMHGLFRNDLQFVSYKTVCQPLTDYIKKADQLREITRLDQSSSGTT